MPPVDIEIDNEELDNSLREFSLFTNLVANKIPSSLASLKVNYQEFSYTLSENEKAWKLFDQLGN